MSSSIVVKENDELKLTSSSVKLPKILAKNNIKESTILKLKEKLESSLSISEENANVEEEKNENISNKKKKKKKKGKKKKKKISLNFKYKLKQSVDLNAKAKELINKNKFKIKNLSKSFPKLKYIPKNKNGSQPNIQKNEQKMESYAQKENDALSKEEINNNEEHKGENNDNSVEKSNGKVTNINIRTFNFRNKEKTLITNKKYVFGKKKKPCMTTKPKIILKPNGNEVDSMNGYHSNNYTSKYLLHKVSRLNDNSNGGIAEGIDSIANVNIRGEKNAITAAIKTNPNEKTIDDKDDKTINDKINEKNINKIDNKKEKENSSDKDDDDTTSQQKKETSEDSSNNQNGVNNFISNNLGRTNLVNNGRKNYVNQWLRSKTKFSFNDTYRRKEEMEKRLARIRKSYQDREVNQSVQNMKTYIYLILPGNASYLVKNCMCHRVNWKEPFSSVTSLYNFRWQQLSFGINYNSLGNIVSNPKQIVNHFENHYAISNKANMFINLMNYLEKRKMSVFKYLPFTIIYQFKDRVNFNRNTDIVKSEAQRLEELKSFINNANKYTVKYEDIGKFFDDEKFKDDQIKREEFEKEKIKKLKKKINKIEDRVTVDVKNNINKDNINKDGNNKDGNNKDNNLLNNNNINNTEDIENLKYVSDVKVYSDFFPNVQPIEKIPTLIKDKDGNYIVEDNSDKDKEKEVIGQNTLVEIPNTHNTGKNIWIVKAINLNRGMCIKIATSFEQIEKIIKRFKEGVDYGFTEDDIEHPKPNSNNNNTDNKENKDNKDNKEINENKDNNKEEEKANKAKEEKKEKIYYCSRIIIQKYIERPLLYYGRKCDIRIWVLLTQNMKAYVFKEGHLKTCSVLYDIDSKDAFTHITNYSFQKYNYNFQKFEKGNEVPFYDFQKFIDDKCYKENYKVNVDLMNKIKEIIKLSMLSVKDKINKNNRNYQFEIFGYDFMLDENFNVFLIEINTNPGLEESSPWIKVIVPRMLDDALRLTLDQLFEPKYDFNQNYKKLDELDILENVLNNLKTNNESNEEDNKDNDDKNKNKNKINNKKYISPFPVPGYEDDENLWDFVCDLNAKDPYDENLTKNEKESNNNANKNNSKEPSYTGIKHLLKKKSNLSKIV